MRNIEDIINNEDWSNRFDEIKGKDFKTSKDLKKEIQRFADKIIKENEEILSQDIFSSEEAQFLFEKVEMEIRCFSMYYQLKGLIQSTDYEFAKNKAMQDTGIEEKTFETLMARGQMLEFMVIFPRVAEYCAEVFKINGEFGKKNLEDLYKNIFEQEEDND